MKVSKKFTRLFAVMLSFALVVSCGVFNVITRAHAATNVEYTITAPKGINRGEVFNISVMVDNLSSVSISAQTLTVSSPSFVGLIDSEIEFESIPAGDFVTKTVRAVALEGGSEDVYLLDESGNRLANFDVRVKGEGYYAGDTHSHSFYSDGVDSVITNCTQAHSIGLDYLFATDHSTLSQKMEVAKFNLDNQLKDEFVALLGDEVTFAAHAVAYGITADPTRASNKQWEVAIDMINAQENSHVHYAHPFLDPFYFTDDMLYNQTHKFDGVEIVNFADYSATHNLQAKDYWDQINTRGEKHYYGYAGSDAHEKKYIGYVYNKGKIGALNQENVMSLMDNGNFYMSNGIDMRFELGGKSFAETLKVTAPTTVNMHIELSARATECKINKVVVYEFNINGTLNVEKNVVIEENLNNIYSYVKDMQVQVKPNTFYRIEAYSVKGAQSNVKGFAYGNPVWVEQATTSNAVTLGEYSCSSLVKTEVFDKFINVGDQTEFRQSTFSVTGGSANTVSYTKGEFGKAGVLTVTYTAEDNATYTDKIYVVDKLVLDENATNQPDTPSDTPNTPQEPADQKGGCGASVNVMPIAVCLTLIALPVVIIKSKKRSN